MGTNASNIVAAPESLADKAGALVLWTLSGPIKNLAFQTAWFNAGLDDPIIDNGLSLPMPPSDKVALARGVKKAITPHEVMKKLSDGGWAIVAFQGGTDDAGANVTAKTELRVWLADDGDLEFTPKEDDRIPKVIALFKLAQTQLAVEDLSPWLAQQVRALDAISIRETGGLYFLPRTKLDLWEKLSAVFHSCSGHHLYAIPALATDADTLALIMEGAKAEAEAAMTAFAKVLEAQRDPDTARGALYLEGRRNEVAYLEQKLKRYEFLLGNSLDAVRDDLLKVDNQLSEAMVAIANKGA